jgi:hypothetical protein
MEMCYWALLFLPLVILHHLLNVFVQLAKKRGFTQQQKNIDPLLSNDHEASDNTTAVARQALLQGSFQQW